MIEKRSGTERHAGADFVPFDLLARLRVSSRPEELALVSGGSRAEVERIQREVHNFLTKPASPIVKAG